MAYSHSDKEVVMTPEVKSEIVKILKEEGLDLAEETAKDAIIRGCSAIKRIVPLISAGVGAIIVPMVDFLEGKLLDLADKIDGKED